MKQAHHCNKYEILPFNFSEHERKAIFVLSIKTANEMKKLFDGLLINSGSDESLSLSPDEKKTFQLKK